MKLTNTTTPEAQAFWDASDNPFRSYVCTVLFYADGCMAGQADGLETTFTRSKSIEGAADTACRVLGWHPDLCHVYARLYDEREGNANKDSDALPPDYPRDEEPWHPTFQGWGGKLRSSHQKTRSDAR